MPEKEDLGLVLVLVLVLLAEAYVGKDFMERYYHLYIKQANFARE